jgi:hypothetical protein
VWCVREHKKFHVIKLTETIKRYLFHLKLIPFFVTKITSAKGVDPLVTRGEREKEKSSYLQNLQYCFMGCHPIRFSPAQKRILSG